MATRLIVQNDACWLTPRDIIRHFENTPDLWELVLRKFQCLSLAKSLDTLPLTIHANHNVHATTTGGFSIRPFCPTLRGFHCVVDPCAVFLAIQQCIA